MVRLVIGAMLGAFVAHSVAAATTTYVFEDANGEFLFNDPIYLGGYSKETLRRQWDENLAERGDDFIDDVVALGGAETFDAYYEASMSAAMHEPVTIRAWRSHELLMEATSYAFFPDGRESYLGVLSAPGDSVVPRGHRMTFGSPQDLVSLDIEIGLLGIEDVQGGVVATALRADGTTVTEHILMAVDAPSPTYLFGNAFRDVSELHLSLFDTSGVLNDWMARYDRLVVTDIPGCKASGLVLKKCAELPAVPIGWPGALLASALICLGLLRRRAP